MKNLILFLMILNIGHVQHKEVRSKADWCALSKDEKQKHLDSPFRCDATTKCDCNNQCDVNPETCDFDERPEGLNK
jgi:hypothetical protein